MESVLGVVYEGGTSLVLRIGRLVFTRNGERCSETSLWWSGGLIARLEICAATSYIFDEVRHERFLFWPTRRRHALTKCVVHAHQTVTLAPNTSLQVTPEMGASAPATLLT